MPEALVTAVLALAVCASAFHVAFESDGCPAGARRIGDVPSMSASEAASRRDARYVAIDSVEQVLALPGHFARMEATYALAGRSDPESRRNLAAQGLFAAYDYRGNEATSRIAELLDAQPDEHTRAMHLHRLADRDPSAAIEYAERLESMWQRNESVVLLARRFGHDGLPGAEREQLLRRLEDFQDRRLGGFQGF